ncbi:MAG: YlmH/Sll1252 family protein, partial [Clostridia bacterium]
DRNIVTSVGFLDPAEQAGARKLLRSRYLFCGGYEGAERKFLFFLPDYMEEENLDASEYIVAYAAACPFGAPSHRDYLGALLGLGIKRECIGDIIVADGGATVIVDGKIAPFVEANFDKVGKFGVRLTRVALASICAAEPAHTVITATVATPRLDAVTSAAFRVSRSLAADAVHSGSVNVNFLEVLNPAAILHEGDLISWRGHGRAKLSAIGGTSKKGRMFIEIFAYVK